MYYKVVTIKLGFLGRKRIMDVIEKKVGDIIIYSLWGQILLCTENECREFFDMLAEEKSHLTVILNMSGVGYINSTGIGMIVKCLKKFRENGGRLVFCSLVPEVLKLFDIIRLTGLIEAYPDEETAIKKITGEKGGFYGQ
jgi:anti-anti-sigma factor